MPVSAGPRHRVREVPRRNRAFRRHEVHRRDAGAGKDVSEAAAL